MGRLRDYFPGQNKLDVNHFDFEGVLWHLFKRPAPSQPKVLSFFT